MLGDGRVLRRSIRLIPLRGWKRLLAGLVAVVMVRSAYLAGDIATVWSQSRGEVRDAALILVLGDRLHPDGSLGRHFQQRLDRALELYRQGRARRILVSGGGRPAEAVVGQAYLEARGVPAAAILVETASCSTFENIQGSARRLAAGQVDGPILLVTNGAHLKRALVIARRHGLPVTGVPAEPGEPNLLAAWRSVAYEVAALSVYPFWVSPGACA